MRDPARIAVILERIRQLWLTYPDMRLGQLIVNVTGSTEPWEIEDDQLLLDLDEWITDGSFGYKPSEKPAEEPGGKPDWIHDKQERAARKPRR